MAFDPPIVDNFTGANGTIDERSASPGPGVWESPAISGDGAVIITSNAISTTTTNKGAVIDSVQYGPDVQVALVFTQLASGSSNYVIAFADGYTAFPTGFGGAGQKAYYLEVQTGGGGAPGQYRLHRDIAGADTVLIDQASSTNFTAPESAGLWILEEGGGTRLTIMRKIGGVWTEEANILDSTGTRPAGLKYLGLGISTSAGTLIADDFMAQTEPVIPVVTPTVAWWGA